MSLHELLKPSFVEQDLHFDDLCLILSQHTEHFKDPTNRSSIQLNDFVAIGNLLKCLEEKFELHLNAQHPDLHSVADDSLSECVAECFRVIRNACAANQTNQAAAFHCHLHESAIKILFQVLSAREVTVSHKARTQEDSDMVADAGNLAVVRVGLQLLGNLVTQNRTCQEAVWTSCFPQFFRLVLECCDTKAMEYLCMLIYNCLDSERGSKLTASSEGSDIVERITKLTTVDGAEWSVLVLEQLITLGHFPVLMNATTDTNARLLLLDMLAGIASCRSQSVTETAAGQCCQLSAVTQDTVNCLCHLFKTTKDCVHSEDKSSCLLGAVVNILSCLTGEEHLLILLQDRQDVLAQAVSILIKTVKDVALEEQQTTPADSSPKHGWSIKRDLVRLIGNLCYKNETNQHLVREKGGIPVILSACNIDDSNPFIRECAVFAIRNLCEGNVENQALISQLEHQGMADSPVWRRIGFRVHTGPDGRQVLQKL